MGEEGTLLDPKTREVVMEGGVKIAFPEDEVRDYSDRILGNVLITKQTGESGKLVSNLYVESGCDIVHEHYLAMLVDRDSNSLLVMASREGGMDIEEVADKNPGLHSQDHEQWQIRVRQRLLQQPRE